MERGRVLNTTRGQTFAVKIVVTVLRPPTRWPSRHLYHLRSRQVVASLPNETHFALGHGRAQNVNAIYIEWLMMARMGPSTPSRRCKAERLPPRHHAQTPVMFLSKLT